MGNQHPNYAYCSKFPDNDKSYTISNPTLVPNRIVAPHSLTNCETHVLAEGIGYKLENKWHRDNKDGSSLEAEPDHPEGRIYRSWGHDEKTTWYLHELPGAPGAYRVQNRYHLVRGKPANMDAWNYHDRGEVYRTCWNNTNAAWYLAHVYDNCYRLENKAHKDAGKPALLDAESRNGYGRVYRSGFVCDNTAWYFTPLDCRLEAEITDFNYENKIDDLTFQPTILETIRIENDSDADVDETIKFTKLKQTTFSFGFKESISYTESMKVGLSLPVGQLPFSVLQEMQQSITLGFEANQQFTFNSTDGIESTKTFKVHARQAIEVSSYVDICKDLELKFTAKAIMTGIGDRLMTDGKVAKQVKLDVGAVVSVLRSRGHKGKIEVCEDGVKISLTGTFKGSWGIRSYTKITDLHKKEEKIVLYQAII